MPVTVTYPGVYIEELPSSAQTVTAASTSATLFAGFFPRGPMGTAVKVESWNEFMRQYGGLDQRSEASYGIYQYFNNGGQAAWVVRLGNGNANAAELKVPVISPSVEFFSKEVAAAARKAQAAATAAQKALADQPVFEAALAAGHATEEAAKATQEAADASKAAGEELTFLIEQYNADYGPEAGATLDAARAAAFAAQKAAQAASIAQVAAAAAAADQNLPKPTDPAVAIAAASGAATKLVGDASKSATESYTQSGGKPSGNVVTALGDAQTALSTAKKSKDDEDASFIQPIEDNIQLGLNAEKSAAAATAALTTAQKNVTATATSPPTIGIETTVASLGAAQSTTAAAVSDLEAWLTSAENLVALNPKDTTLQGNLEKLLSDLQKAFNSGVLAMGEAQAANAAGIQWKVALDEDDLRDEAGFQSAGQQALTAFAQAITVGQQLLALGQTDGTKEGVAKEIQTLQSAQQALELAMTQVAAGETPDPALSASTLETLAKNLESSVPTTVQGLKLDGSNLSTATALFDWLAANETSYLALQVVVDLVTTVVSLDDAMDAATASLSAAQQATVEANLAMQKAQQAILAGLEDEADAEQVMWVKAANPGVWGNNLQVEIVRTTQAKFDLDVREMALQNNRLVTVAQEKYHGLTLGNATAANYAPAVVNDKSQLLHLTYNGLTVPGTRPNAPEDYQDLAKGSDGGPPGASDLFPVTEAEGGGLPAAVEAMKPNIFNILCLPVIATYSAGAMSTAIDMAIQLAQKNRAFFIADIPAAVNTTTAMEAWINTFGNADAVSAAVYYPRLLVPDPLANNRNRNVGPSGTVAGIYAINDLNFGVWKAPAGTTAVVENAQLAVKVSDEDDGDLNPLGVNVLRNFNAYGNVVWGARTLAGNDLLGSQFKYLNVRRLTDFIEDSLVQSLKWAVFQDNNERLWAQISTEVGTFMAGLFAAGAFQGTSASQAYLVRCDSTTTTPTDIEKGIVNVLVAFAPVKPAEFIVVQIQQLAGQGQAS